MRQCGWVEFWAGRGGRAGPAQAPPTDRLSLSGAVAFRGVLACGALVAASFPGDAHLSRRRSVTRVRVPSSAVMADAEPEAEGGSEDGCSGSRAPSSQRGSAARVAPLGPEQLQRVLEQVTKAQPPAEPAPPPCVLDKV